MCISLINKKIKVALLFVIVFVEVFEATQI